MTIPDDALVIGLTGAFGSGCTTLAEALTTLPEPDRRFRGFRTSDLIRREVARRGRFDREMGHTRTRPVVDDAEKRELQDMGDRLRQLTGMAHYWIARGLDLLDAEPESIRHVVIDGIRNPGEIEWLRERFPNFLLVAVDASADSRWERVKHLDDFKGHRENFDRLARRDVDSRFDLGQKVQACVDVADYVIVNEDHRPLRDLAAQSLYASVQRLLGLVDGSIDPRPLEDEVHLHMAFAASSRSACLKRQVGAVVVRPKSSMDHAAAPQTLLAVGYNENADGTETCVDAYDECYRDLWRRQQRAELGIDNCPQCGSQLLVDGNDVECSRAECESHSDGVLDVIFPGRAMTHCTAVHAEQRAIKAVPPDELRGATLYTTTFPCFLCAVAILHAGIRKVVYVEPYPDPAALELLRGKVELEPFQGVKSRAFNQLLRVRG